MASVSEGWAGRTGAQWRISELGEGRRFPATFRQSGVAAPARALWLSSSFRGRLHQNLPPPPTPTHTLLASLALTSTHSGTEGLESQSFSYWGARRLCASMARDGLKRKVRPFLRVPRPARRRLPPARPLFNQKLLVTERCPSHGVSAGGRASRLPSCRSQRMQRPRLAEIEHRGRGEGGVAGRACAGRTDGGTGSGGGAQPGHLPHALLGTRQRAQNPAVVAAGDPERLGVEVGATKRAPAEERGAVRWRRISGYARARMGRGSQGSCIVGRARREDGRGSGWSAQPSGQLAVSGAAGGDGARCWLRGPHREGPGWWGKGGGVLRSGCGSGAHGHLWKPFVPTPQWEAPRLFRIQHTRRPRQPSPTCAAALCLGHCV